MTQVVELSGDEKALLQSYDRAIKKQVEFELALRNGGAAGDAAGTQIEDALNKVKRANDQALKGLLGDLKSLGPDGAAAADALKGHFVETGKAGYQSFDKILDQIRAIDPEAANAAAAARNALNDAANSSEAQFHDILEEMRALGPEGRKAAEQIKANFVEAGLISEKKVEDIAKAFDKIDPAAAKAAQSVITNMKHGTDTSTGMFQKFGESAIAEITAIAGAYFGIQEAISNVNQYLDMQKERIRDIANAQVELAAVQETASKNLVGLEKAERLGLLNKAPAFAVDVGISEQRVTAAFGEVASAGVNDPAEIENIVREAAKVTKLNPEKLADTAGGAADIMQMTGLKDVRQALALFVTTQTASKVGEADALQASLPNALNTGQATAPKQNKEDAARETAALFALGTLKGSDKEGKATSTFLNDLMSREDAFFSNLDRSRIDARSKLQILGRKENKTEADLADMADLNKFLQASEGIKDPGTQFGRLQALRDPALAKQFLGPAGTFGEARFRTFLKELLENNSDTAKQLDEMTPSISTDVSKFNDLSKELLTATPQAQTAAFKRDSEAIQSGTKVQLTNEGNAAEIARQTDEMMRASYATGLAGWMQWMGDFNPMGTGTNAADAAMANILRLQERADSLAADGLQVGDAEKIAGINAQIERIFGLIEGGAGISPEDARKAAAAARAREQEKGPSGLARDSMTREETDKMNKTLLRLESVLLRIAASNDDMVAPAQATANNTAPRIPPVTPTLGKNQP